MAGIFAIVGPSGAGKDTLMEAVRAADPRILLVRRVITRPASAGGEDFDGVTEDEFDRLLAAGTFALHWPAHGLRYGVPGSVKDDMAAGNPVLFNGSRRMLAAANEAFPGLKVIHITARREVLEARLVLRGRESAEDVAQRLDRAAEPLPEGLDVVEIDNSGALETAVQAILAVVQPESA